MSGGGSGQHGRMTYPPLPPDQITNEVKSQLASLTNTVQKLERAVDGDPHMNVPSLRQAVKGIADELKDEAESLCERIDKLEEARQAQENYLKGMTVVGKFLGLTSLAGVLGLIAQLAGWVSK